MAERPEDLNLPVAVINRLVKETLPEGVNVSKEAKAAISKAASVFVLFATSCANNFALRAKRKTLNGQDVLSAMTDMDFEKFIEPLRESLEFYRREQKERKDALEKRKKTEEDGLITDDAAGGADQETSAVVDENDNSNDNDDDEEDGGDNEGGGGSVNESGHSSSDDGDENAPDDGQNNVNEDEDV